MVIRYPNGKAYQGCHSKKTTHKVSQAKLSKDSSIFKAAKKYTHSNRGMNLESLINSSIKYYRENNIAIIHKKPTPVQIVNVDYPKRSAAKITEAYFRRASTTDYNGIYKGHYIDFEAKETKNKTSFPLQNFHDHQISHMKDCHNQGGIVFVIIYFSTLKECYLLPAEILFEVWDEYLAGGRKSIKHEWIVKKAYPITISYAPSIPFIDILDKLL